MASHGKFKWVRPEVYPLLAAVGVGVVAMVVALQHSIFSDPVVVLSKSRRGEDPELTAGSSHYNHIIRRFSGGRGHTILPDFFRKDQPDEDDEH